MTHQARQHYLETQVLTATPEKLHLMLIDAAIRAAHRAAEHWRRQENEQACMALIRAQQTVTAMLKALNHEAAPELTSKMAGVYMFVFRTLVEANRNHDTDLLADAVHILSVERETWRQVCDRTAGRKSSEASPSDRSTSPPHILATPDAPIQSELAGGFSMEV